MIKQDLCSKYPDINTKEIRVISSPLRVCPFGAHIDHQNGLLAGFAIDITVDLAYVPDNDGYVRMKSMDYSNEEYFHVNCVPAILNNCWGNYLRGAVLALKSRYMITKGIKGVIRGKGLVGGMSSSAAVTTAYLMALCDVNNIKLDKIDYVMLGHIVEKNYIGLKNGILDQSMNVLSKKQCLTVMDPESLEYRLIKKPANMKKFELAIVYSGIEKPLIETNYNENVDVCKTAAWILKENAGLELGRYDDTTLRDVPYEVYEKYSNCLVGRFKKRAQHFYSENERVHEGIKAWESADIEKLGRIMFESGESSINNYNCGCKELITIFNIFKSLKGVYGARFSGAGYRGCCIGIIDPDYKKKIEQEMTRQYIEKHPEYKGRFVIRFAKLGNGAGYMKNTSEGMDNNESNYFGSGLCNKNVSTY